MTTSLIEGNNDGGDDDSERDSNRGAATGSAIISDGKILMDALVY